jgi:hypothetical protein
LKVNQNINIKSCQRVFVHQCHWHAWCLRRKETKREQEVAEQQSVCYGRMLTGESSTMMRRAASVSFFVVVVIMMLMVHDGARAGAEMPERERPSSFRMVPHHGFSKRQNSELLGNMIMIRGGGGGTIFALPMKNVFRQGGVQEQQQQHAIIRDGTAPMMMAEHIL